MHMLENTPEHLLGDARYAADKTVRDAAWDTWRARSGQARTATGFASAEALEESALGASPVPQLLSEGYFVRVATGDTRAASLWARLVAFRFNAGGATSEPGALRKGGGHNVDGYAEDAIALNANPADLFNVVDLVSGAGAPGASPVWNGPLPRRASDTWEAPRALSEADLSYLRGGTAPGPNPNPQPQPPAPARVPEYEAIGGDQVFRQKIGVVLQQDYKDAGQTLNDGSAVWFARPIYWAMRDMVLNGTEPTRALDAAIARYRKEWRAVLGLPS